MPNWLINEGPRYALMITWVIINAILFGTTFAQYWSSDEYFYLRSIVGVSLPVARASAMCLNFNVLLILLPVCRNLLSYLRESCSCCCRSLQRLLDKQITFHTYLGYSICFFTVIHIGAHCFNFERLVDAHTSKNGLHTTLSNAKLSPNSSYISINPVSSASSDPTLEIFKTVAGVSGLVMTVVLLFMITSSTYVIRRSSFEVFYYTHHLFIIFFIGLISHGFGRIVRRQINLKEHNPHECATKFTKWGLDKKCPIPWFAGTDPKTWMWVIGPLLIYTIERIVRLVRSALTVNIVKVVAHPSKVFELQMKKSNFSHKPGEYILLNCPSISFFEWHPFTLTSAPNDDYFSVHIRRVGDWTNALAVAVRADDQSHDSNWKLPKICVDGPFGTPCEEFFRYNINVLIGTGIGITPFASVLKHIWNVVKDERFRTSLEKVYLVWICREISMFEWFQDLLLNLESQCLAGHKRDFLDFSIYLTRGWNVNQARNIIMHNEYSRDVITGLTEKTQFGRPQWDAFFSKLVSTHSNSVKIGVFFCGASELSKELHKLCNQYSASDTNGIQFYYNKEHF